jgi:hypothetical protein
MSLLREYTLGDKPVQIELLSDPAEGKAAGVSYAKLPLFQHALFSMSPASQQSTMRTRTSTSQFPFSQFTEIMMIHKALARSVHLALTLDIPLFTYFFSFIRKEPFALLICCRWRDSSITLERLSFPSVTSLLKESPYGPCFCARGIPTWDCTGLGMSRMQESILSSEVTASECICRRIRATGSTYSSYTKIGAAHLRVPMALVV